MFRFHAAGARPWPLHACPAPLLQSFPPVRERLERFGQVDRLADAGRQQPVGFSPARRHGTLEWFVPGMAGQGESARMPAQHRACIQYLGRARRLFGIHVDVRPAHVVLSGVEGDKVETVETLGDGREMRAEAGVAAEIELALRRLLCGFISRIFSGQCSKWAPLPVPVITIRVFGSRPFMVP